MSHVFVYVEYQISYPFENLDIPTINEEMQQFPGLISKTWLSGINNQSIGGFYEFGSKENAQNYIDNGCIPYTKQFNANITVKFFDAAVVAKASKGMNSPYF